MQINATRVAILDVVELRFPVDTFTSNICLKNYKYNYILKINKNKYNN